ncbi:Uncharacterized conserved protein YjbJ, UPF0337 family [Hydrocarboniphaga daqingensis]|uniref:Uncharacterized conserved protein YjbJ, UPF0337 family n=1 Tax=Hydrocarboniphaga daqingensis TaxID=490188 RepID=A0A1M5LQZ8_9GAMM|nr:CsbD family protein [Hydrocarboniphaga daqingensis]SHG67468.1 Uncharacterized conserved protein YjbJ, UPF0337 family [Hydrocarboniphaga daqingensis]
MDKHQIQGKAKQVIGAARQKTGELIDNKEMQAKGGAQRVEGKIQEGYGKTKEAVKDGVRKLDQ